MNLNREGFNAVVRPVVTLAMTAGVLYGFVVGLIGFWFGQRQETKPPAQAQP